MPKFKAVVDFTIVHELFTSFIEILCETFPNDVLHHSHFWLYGANRQILTFFDLHFKKGPGLKKMYYMLYFDCKYECFVQCNVLRSQIGNSLCLYSHCRAWKMYTSL